METNLTKDTASTVVIKEFISPQRAELAATILRDSGIECEIIGELLNYVMPHIGTQVKLIVRTEDEEAALTVLKDLD